MWSLSECAEKQFFAEEKILTFQYLNTFLNHALQYGIKINMEKHAHTLTLLCMYLTIQSEQETLIMSPNYVAD